MLRKQAIATLLLFLTITTAAYAQSGNGESLKWIPIDEALQMAGEQEKLVLIDVYAAWCPYCQRMQSEVYPDSGVEEIIREYFVPVRINIESDQGVTYLGESYTQAQFARALRFQSVPTTYFMNPRGEVVGQQPGFLPIDTFSALLRYVGSGAYEHQSFQEFQGE